MALSNMQVFNDYIMPAAMVTLDQEIAKFNAASGGTIMLSSEGMLGDFAINSFFNSLSSAQRRVNRYGVNSDVTATPLVESKEASVKVAGGFGPVAYEPSQMTWLQRPTQQGVTVAGQAFAQLLVQDQLNSIVAALVAAISNNTEATNNVSSGAKVDYASLNNAHAKFGDMSGQLRASVMTGQMMHKLYGQNITNDNRLFTAGGVQVIDILGKLSVITDAPALLGTGVDKVLSLVQGAGTVSGATSVLSNVATTNGKDRIETTFQADYDFGLSVKGYSWNETVKSPGDAAIATGANWSKSAQFTKMTAGVITIGDV